MAKIKVKKLTIKKGTKVAKSKKVKLGKPRRISSGKIKVYKKSMGKKAQVTHWSAGLKEGKPFPKKGAKGKKKGKIPKGLFAWMNKKGGKK